MKRPTERILAAALALLPALAGAQAAASAQAMPTEVAAKAPAPPPPPANGLNQTKDQLTRLPSAAEMRPNGPVTIGANRAELVQGNSAVYIGGVTLDSDTLKMDGDRLELKRAADGQYTARITGSPAHMSHVGSGPDNPPMNAQAKTVTYDSRSGAVDLVGDAVMTKGDEKTTAEKITYNLLQQRYEASGGEGGNSGGRVIIIIPQVAPAAPAPAAQPAAGGPAPAGAAPAAAAPAPATRSASPAPADATANGPKP